MHRSYEHYHNLPLMMNSPPIIVHWIFQMAKSMPERFRDMFKGLVKWKDYGAGRLQLHSNPFYDYIVPLSQNFSRRTVGLAFGGSYLCLTNL